MITLDALLVFLGTAAIPVIYLLLWSRWVEPEYRRAYPQKPGNKPASIAKNELLARDRGRPQVYQEKGKAA